MSKTVFVCECSDTAPGDDVCCVGDLNVLGQWDISKSIRLQTDAKSWPIWESPIVTIPPQTNLEYKFIVYSHGYARWEDVCNRKACSLETDVVLIHKWNNPNVEVETRKNRTSRSSSTRSDVALSEFAESGIKLVNDSEFNKSMSHDDPLEVELDDAADRLVERDREAVSWRQKFMLINDEIFASIDGSPTEEQVIDRLVDASIYLSFLKQGCLKCEEDGAHFRPNHVANTCRAIFSKLSTLSADIEERNDSFADSFRIIVRKIYPSLVSFNSEFVCAQPLTRIRDIAHRNDIPGDLKKHIKDKIQNKLHRCAGPEDLVAAEKLLEQVLSGSHSQGFVSELKIFVKELKQFFSASNLLERLQHIMNFSAAKTKILIRQFIESVQRCSNTSNYMTLLECFRIGTQLREELVTAMNQCMQIEHVHQLMLVDIGIEQYAFVLTSQLSSSAEGGRLPWSCIVDAISLAVSHVQLAGMNREECAVIVEELNGRESELEGTPDAECLLALKAALDRTRRISDTYCSIILKLLKNRVAMLGYGLKVPAHAIKFFCESDIRQNLVFRLSELCSMMLANVRKTARLPPWDTIVPKSVGGRLLSVPTLDQYVLPPKNQGPYVLLVANATGNEELAGIRSNSGVEGILLGHTLPHLCHMAVRAREEMVLLACLDGDMETCVRDNIGSLVNCTADSCGVRMERIKKEDLLKDNINIKVEKIEVPYPKITVEWEVLLGDDITIETSGNKAAACAKLANMGVQCRRETIFHVASLGNLHSTTPSSRKSALVRQLFKTPKTCAVPFGVMELSLKAAGALDEYNELMNQLNLLRTSYLDNDANNNKLNECVESLQILIGKCQLPSKIVEDIQDVFNIGDLVICRSSANVEDLPGISAAGLYDSIPGVPVSSSEALSTNIVKVWTSLYTRRAVVSRAAMKIDENIAKMSVLVQENLRPLYSFIIHTVNPLSNDANQLYVEICPGLGESLTSGCTLGAPHRLVVNRETEEHEMLSFCSFSYGIELETTQSNPHEAFKTHAVCHNYCGDLMTTSHSYRSKLAIRLCQIARELESAFGGAQDIEGCIVGLDVYIVQTRSQHLTT
eukprot:GHVL01026875.1.p1 GENE.GHVL01026875.1~~GHVL01026875.1.p1  ORF type:complete len:1084 (-),score=146.71 GHVL01026875.1:279-3530(-)